MKSFVAILFLLTLSACGHFHRVLEPKPTPLAPEGIKVKIGSKEVRAGDQVVVFKSICKSPSTTRGNAPQRCTQKTMGRAKVVEVLDEKTAVIEPIGEFKVDNSMNVEKEE